MGFSPTYQTKNKTKYISIDFVDQSTGAIIWHRVKPVVLDDPSTFRDFMRDTIDSFLRAQDHGDYCIMLSSYKPVNDAKQLDIF